MAPALTVPYPFDVIIDGQGYVFADTEEQKAAFGISPVFVPRQNTQGDYGDNQQDFWLTYSQKDWSKGEGQKYQGRDDDGKARYYFGSNVDPSVPGEVTLRKANRNITFAANPTSATADLLSDRVYVTTSTTLYHVVYDGTITSLGAHGLGAAPGRFGLVNDGRAQYMSTASAGTVGVRKWNGAAFSTFSATGADSLAFLNNTLYGYIADSNKLIRYDSGGTASDVFLWRDAAADGSGYTVTAKLVPFGGKLLILRYRNSSGGAAELWVYDGNSTSKLTEFAPHFNAYDCEILNGVVFVGGCFEKHISTATYQRPAVYFYKDGQQDVLWRHENFGSTATFAHLPALGRYQEGLIWNEDVNSAAVMHYDPSNGGVSHGASSIFTGNVILVGTATFYLNAATGTTAGIVYPGDAAFASGGNINSSLFDFDSSLRKIFRGVRVDWEAASDGNGGTVDILYKFDSTSYSASYTTLQTSAVSGTEYLLPAPTLNSGGNRSISVSVILNKGTSTDGPKLKRVSIRGVPIVQGFKKRQYVLLLGGRDGDSHVKLRDDSFHNLDGGQMAANLETTASKDTTITIVDHLSGSAGFTGVVESLQMMEYKPEQWIATVSVRQV